MVKKKSYVILSNASFDMKWKPYYKQKDLDRFQNVSQLYTEHKDLSETT